MIRSLTIAAFIQPDAADDAVRRDKLVAAIEPGHLFHAQLGQVVVLEVQSAARKASALLALEDPPSFRSSGLADVPCVVLFNYAVLAGRCGNA